MSTTRQGTTKTLALHKKPVAAPKTYSPGKAYVPRPAGQSMAQAAQGRTALAARPVVSKVIAKTPAPAPAPTPTKIINKRKKSPTIAPDVLPPDVGPGMANPSDTVPAEDPYAPDAAWTDFQDQDISGGATGDNWDIEVGPATVEPDAPKMPEPKPPVAKLSWFDKFLAWFGLSRKKVSEAVMAGEAATMASMSQTEAAAQLVRRARNGDQNAMAMIACVRDAAAQGNAKAIMSAKFMKDYIQRNPVDDSSEFGIDDVIPRKTPKPSDPATAAAMALSHGPPLTNPRIEEFVKAAKFTSEEIRAFKHGFDGRPMRNPAENIQQANRAGFLVAHARKLQLVRLPHTNITKKFDANIGWELGEDLE